MIKLENLTPNIYTAASRDFQFICRLYDIALNNVKTNSDIIYSLPFSANSDSSLVDLMTTTLGFKSKHKYNTVQLSALCNVFWSLLKKKGTLSSIVDAANVLLTAEGITEEVFVEQNPESPFILDIYLPQELKDTTLFKDLLSYLLPAGMSCNIIKELRQFTTSTSSVTFSSDIKIYNGAESFINNSTPTSSWPTKAQPLAERPDKELSIVIKPEDIVTTDQYTQGRAGTLINSGVIIVPETQANNAELAELNNKEN